MFTKIINFLLIYEILTMRSVKRKEGNTKTKINLTKSRNTFKSEIDDELIKMYGRFFVPNKSTFFNFQSKSEATVNKSTGERGLLPEELIQEYAVIFPESFDFENVGSLVVDEFGNIMELTEVPITNENSVLSLYEDISSDSNASENEFNNFKRIISTEIDQQETLNIFNKPKEIQSTDNNDVSKFLLPFTLSESTDEKVLEERWINNFVEDMAFSQEINIDELHTLILNESHKSSVDFSSSEINADQDVPTDTEKQLLDFNNILEMEPTLNPIKISSKHSIHEKIDAEIIEEILDIYDIQNPVEYSLKHNKFVEYNTNENLDYQELSHLQDKNKPNINNPIPEHTEIYKGSLNMPENMPSTSMPVLNITSFVRTPSSDLPTIVEMPSDVSSLQQSSKVLVTSEASPRPPEISLQPLPQDFIQRNYSKIFLNIKDIETSSIFAEWQISRLDEINLFIKFVQFSKTKYLHIIKSFFDYLDEELMFILDELKLKRIYQLEKYDPHEYKTFILTMIESINKANLFSILMKYRNNHEKIILLILCFEFVQLFNYFPNFPELITLGCLFNQGGDERLILYLRLIHLIINENMNRLNEMRPVVLFLIKKSFVTPDRRCKDINIKVFEKFVISSFYCINSVCKKDHSNFSFFLWEFPPKKLKSMKYEAKVEGGYFYEITKNNVEFFRVVLHSFIFQHIMFTEYHNITYERYEKLIDKSFKPGECIFCLFEEYLGYLSTDIPENEKE